MSMSMSAKNPRSFGSGVGCQYLSPTLTLLGNRACQRLGMSSRLTNAHAKIYFWRKATNTNGGVRRERELGQSGDRSIEFERAFICKYVFLAINSLLRQSPMVNFLQA